MTAFFHWAGPPAVSRRTCQCWRLKTASCWRTPRFFNQRGLTGAKPPGDDSDPEPDEAEHGRTYRRGCLRKSNKLLISDPYSYWRVDHSAKFAQERKLNCGLAPATGEVGFGTDSVHEAHRLQHPSTPPSLLTADVRVLNQSAILDARLDLELKPTCVRGPEQYNGV